MDARRLAAAYYHLVRGEDRVVITTSSSASGCVFSLNLHAQVIRRVECVRACVCVKETKARQTPCE